MARRKAQTYGVRDLAGSRRRLSARQSRRLVGTGPCFSPVRRARTRRPILQPAPGRGSYWPRRELRCRPSAHVASTSPQAPHLVPPSRTPRDDALQLDEVMRTLREVLAAGIRPDSRAAPLPGYGQFQARILLDEKNGCSPSLGRGRRQFCPRNVIITLDSDQNGTTWPA